MAKHQQAYEWAMFNNQRQIALDDYARQRADALSDYERQRADALADAERERSAARVDQDEYFERTRTNAERAGFNPLSVLGMLPSSPSISTRGVGIAAPGINPVAPTVSPMQSNNYMGASIADAAMMLAEGLERRGAVRQGRTIQDLNRQKDILTRRLAQETIRPKMGGVYERGGAFGTGGRDNADNAGDTVATYRLGRVDVPDPKLDRASPGYFAGLSWDATPGFSPGQVWEDRYGDTPLNWPLAAGQMAADIGYNTHKAQNYFSGYWFGAGPIMTIGGREWVMEPYTPKSQWRRNYQPSYKAGYDALTGSTFPSARISQ